MSKQYTVSCECPTELAANPWKVLAKDEADAIAKFKRRNGISQTDHKITAVEDETRPAVKNVSERTSKGSKSKKAMSEESNANASGDTGNDSR